MTVEIIPFRTEDLPAIGAFLHSMEPSRSPESWQSVICPRWPWPEGYFGHMLVIDDVINGVVCQMQCLRRYGGDLVTGCNITSWYVSPDLRGQGFGQKMLAAALAEGDWVYTNQSPEPYTVNAFKRVGFAAIDTTEWIIPNLPGRHRAGFVATDDIARHLSGEALENYTAHAALPGVGHVGLRGPGDRFCHIAFVRSQWHKLAAARIIYASDYDLLERCLPAFSGIALRRYRMPLTAIEKRRCAARPAMAIAERPRDPILFRGGGVRAEQIDSLFCEVVTFAPALR